MRMVHVVFLYLIPFSFGLASQMRCQSLKLGCPLLDIDVSLDLIGAI